MWWAICSYQVTFSFIECIFTEARFPDMCNKVWPSSCTCTRCKHPNICVSAYFSVLFCHKSHYWRHYAFCSAVLEYSNIVNLVIRGAGILRGVKAILMHCYLTSTILVFQNNTFATVNCLILSKFDFDQMVAKNILLYSLSFTFRDSLLL